MQHFKILLCKVYKYLHYSHVLSCNTFRDISAIFPIKNLILSFNATKIVPQIIILIYSQMHKQVVWCCV